MDTLQPVSASRLQAGFELAAEAGSGPAARLLFAGDLFAGGRAEAPLKDGAAHLLWGELMEETSQHDFCVANLECPLTDTDAPILKSGPAFRADPQCAQGILAGGFDTVSMANNHIRDMGDAGVVDTLAACERAGLRTVGAGRNLEDAAKTLFVTVNGLRVAILAIAENEFSVATESSAGAWPLDLADNFRQIRAAKEQADLVLVIFHGGVEYYPLPTPAMTKTCRFFAEAGADGVICHHIHVPSGLEVHHGVPIVYGMGNFLFDRWPPEGNAGRSTGYMVSLDVRRGAVTKLQLIPYFQTQDECRARLMDASAAAAFLTHIADLSATIADKDALQREFDGLAASKRTQCLTSVLSLGRIERRLLKTGVWPFWRTSPLQFAKLLNQFSCESHRELVLSVLRSEIVKRRSS